VKLNWDKPGSELTSTYYRPYRSNVGEDPMLFLDEKIGYRDEESGIIVQYRVLDCGTSVVEGKYVVLEDEEGRKTRVSEEQFRANCVPLN
jgi:hypothetical protein